MRCTNCKRAFITKTKKGLYDCKQVVVIVAVANKSIYDALFLLFVVAATAGVL